MTEKRIKELAEVIHEDCMFDDPGQQYKMLKETENIIRTVAAEARDEAIDEFLKKVKMGWKYRADEKTITLHELDEVTARLKERARE